MIDSKTGYIVKEDAFDSAMKGLDAGVHIQNINRMDAMRAELENLSKRADTKPTDYSYLLRKYPELEAQIKPALANSTEREIENDVNFATGISFAIKSGKTDSAISELHKRAEIYDSQGEVDKASSARTFAGLIKSNPTQALSHAGLYVSLAGLPKDGNVSTNYHNFTAAESNATELPDKAYELRLKNQASAILNSNLPSSQGLDNELKRSQIEMARTQAGAMMAKATAPAKPESLSPSEKIQLNTTLGALSGASAKVSENLNTVDSLISDFSKMSKGESGGGVAKRAMDFAKMYTTGEGTERSSKWLELKKFMTEQVIGNLPPGSASDADIRLILETIPSENAGSAEILRWLSNAKSVLEKKRRFDKFTSAFVSKNEGYLETKKPLVVHGVTIPAGLSFSEASDLYYNTIKDRSVAVLSKALSPSSQKSTSSIPPSTDTQSNISRIMREPFIEPKSYKKGLR